MIDNIAYWLMVSAVLLPMYLWIGRSLHKKVMIWKTTETGNADWYYRKPTLLTLMVFPVIFPLIVVIKGMKFLARLA
jgi:hypothetical protein